MAAPIATGPKTCRELFSDPCHNPCGSDPAQAYSKIFVRWHSNNSTPMIDELHRDILTDFDSAVGAIGFFVKDPRSSTGVLKVTHGFRTHAGTAGTATPCHGKTFGHVGDVVRRTNVDTFESDPNQLEWTSADTICADNPETHQQLLDTEPEAEILEPISTTAQAKKMIRTRTAMYIPFSLVEHVLGKDLTARQAFEVIWANVQAQGLCDNTRSLMNFLMVATTKHSTTSNSRVLLDHLGIAEVGNSGVLSDRRNRVLYSYLLALIPPTMGTASNPQMHALISHVVEMNGNTRLERVDRQALRRKAEQPTTIRERYHDYATDKLLRLTEVGLNEDLPLGCHELTARKKGMSKRLILQQAFDVTQNALNLNQFLASPTHVIDLESWDWFGTNIKSLGTCLLPFSIAPPEPLPKKRKKRSPRIRTKPDSTT